MNKKLLFSMSLLLLAGFGSSAQAQTWTGKSVAEAKDSTVYLWNVGAKKFLGKGGKWGTEATISTVGTPFKVSAKTSGSTTYYMLESLIKAQSGSTSTNGALGFTNGENSKHDRGNYFVDRGSGDDSSYGTRYFTFAAVETGSTTYQIKVTSKSGASDAYTGTFYLYANMANGEKIEGVKSVPDDSTAYSQWILVTEGERKAAFYKAEASTANAVPATFLISDQDFARNDNSISEWKVTGENAGYTSFGALENYTTKVKKPTDYSSTSDSYIYYVGNGYTDGDISATGSLYIDPLTGDTLDTNNDYKNRQGAYGGDWTANIHGESGKVYQTITPLRAGWYKVSCVGFTTDSAVLFAQVGSAATGKQYATDKLLSISGENVPATYVEASRLINNPDKSYDKSVLVYVPEGEKGSLDKLTFGIIVSEANDTAWACFDNFQLDYLGDPKYNLVLDEDQTNGNYITAQGQQKDANNEEYTGKKTLYLHRTLNENKWNSIVLPVTLTVGQVKSAFGDQVRISAFKGAIEEDHPERIIFQKISANRDESNDIAIEAGNLYLIKPTNLDYTTDGDARKVEIDGEEAVSITDYYTIPGVVFNCEEKADYTSKVQGDKGAETYKSDTQVQFVGTYVKLSDDNKIPVNSYVLNGNNQGGTAGVWYYRTKETASKGFRGWLQTCTSDASDNTSGAAKKLTYLLEGVEEELDGGTTSIDNLVNGDMIGKKISGNIYNLNGQLVRTNTTNLEGLSKGVYVVGGKKMIVK